MIINFWLKILKFVSRYKVFEEAKVAKFSIENPFDGHYLFLYEDMRKPRERIKTTRKRENMKRKTNVDRTTNDGYRN